VREKHALICGVAGQDGAYLARLLAERGYRVVGTTRGDPAHGSVNLAALGIVDRVALRRMDPLDRGRVEQLIAESDPAEIYYLSAQSSVWRSFEQPVETFQASAIGLINVLEAARAIAPAARLFSAASGDCFGEAPADRPANEQAAFAPRSPYAAAKCAGHHALAAARLAYGQYACSGFLFTHESPLRPDSFAVGKTVAAARRIAAGSDEELTLGNVEIVRDWGWAPDYVEAMWRMLQRDEPLDFVIASGRSASLGQLVEEIFAAVGLDWRQHVTPGTAPPRPADIRFQHADPSRARLELAWSGAIEVADLAARLVRGPDNPV